MPEAIAEAMVRPLKKDDAGLFSTALTLVPNIADQGMKAAFGMTRAVHVELFQATNRTVDWVESLQEAPFKLARETIKNLEKTSADVIGNLETLGGAVAKAMRGSTETASDVVSRMWERRAG